MFVRLGTSGARFSGWKRRAFALSEVMVAVFILSVALIGVAASIEFGMTSAEHGRNVTQAEVYARQMMEYVENSGLVWNTVATMPPSSTGVNDGAGVTQPLGAPPMDTSGISDPSGRPLSSSTVTPFSRHIEITSSVAAVDSGDTGWKLDVRQIAITISWFENGKPRSINLKSYLRRPL